MPAPNLPTPTAGPPPNAASGLVSGVFSSAQTYAFNSYMTAFSAIGNIQDNLENIAFDDLVTWLTTAITSPAVGIPTAIQQDMWNLETERDALALADAKDRMAQNWAKGGWALPDGVLEASLAETDREYLNKRLDKSREIRIRAEEQTIANTHFAVQWFTQLVTSHEAVIEKGFEAISQTSSQLAAAAMASAHAQANVGYSTSQSLDENISNSTMMASYWNTNISE